MHKYLEFIKHNKEIFSFALFVLTTLIILTITLILVRTNQDVRSRAATAPCSLTNPIIIDLTEQEFIEILNTHRQTLGAGPLRISENLTKLAQWQAEDMIENNYRGHVDSTGRSAEQRLIDCGINGSTAGENIVWSTTSAQDAFNKWMNSTGHKENIEKGSYSQIGISRMNEGGTWVWVNTFSSGNDGTTPDLEDPSTPVPEVKDCGSQTITLPNSDPNYPNLQCMIDNAASCTAAKLIVDLSIDLSPLIDMEVNSKGSYDFYNNSNNKCALNIKIDQQNVTRFPGGITEEEKENISREVKKLENTQGTCVFNQYSDLVTFLTKIKNGEYSSSSDPDSESNMFRNAVCAGSYFDMINPSPTGPQNPTPTTHQITPTTPPAEGTVPIKFSFKLAGIGANAALGENHPFRPTRTIPIVFQDDGSFAAISEARYKTDTSLFEGTAYIDEQRLIPSSSLKFILKSATEQLVPISSITNNTVPQFRFTMGDINSSNSVDLNDYIDMVACIKRIRCTPDEISIDLNDDSIVDILDLNILLRAIRDFNQ